MEERAWVNTLSNEEFVKWGIKFFRTDWDDASVVMSFKEIRESAIKLLSKPHETTADEDFAEIGFYQMNFTDFGKPSEVVSYGFGDDKYMVAIYKDGQNVYTADTGLRWTDDLIDQIRTIADKKRKELGWK